MAHRPCKWCGVGKVLGRLGRGYRCPNPACPRKNANNTKPCKWCGAELQTEGSPGVRSGPKMKCRNPECPRKGVVPWALPVMTHPMKSRRFAWMSKNQEDDPLFEGVIRAIEDFSPTE